MLPFTRYRRCRAGYLYSVYLRSPLDLSPAQTLVAIAGELDQGSLTVPELVAILDGQAHKIQRFRVGPQTAPLAISASISPLA